jgi:hypothetical protein
MTQEHLPHKCKALSSDPSTDLKKEKMLWQGSLEPEDGVFPRPPFALTHPTFVAKEASNQEIPIDR